ncbi:MAG: RluA family pseudouridine synthase [Candidatus Absconditabacteria bacterium]
MDIIEYNGLPNRIDMFLTKELNYSRNFFQHLINRGGIKVNNSIVKKSYKLKQGDRIEIESLERFLSSEVLQESPFVQLNIMLEKDDYLVVYKPKGILSHPNSVWDVKSASVAGFLYHQYKALPSIGNFIRAGLIHRLDKNTDGFMIIVKTEKGLAYFKNLFQRKSLSTNIEGKENVPLKKYYFAKCFLTEQGNSFLTGINGKFPYYINELVKNKGAHTKEFKIGITKILDFKIKGEFVNINLEILTGRTHQIRYHLSSLGLPILGDELYGKKIDNTEMQLTNTKLEFEDVYGNYEIITL